MDTSFYEVIIPKLKKLMFSLKDRGLHGIVDRVKKYWIKLDDLALTNPTIVYGIDGGSSEINFKGFILGLITGVSIGYKYDNGMYLVNNILRTAFIDKITPPIYVSDRITLYREIIEGKLAVHSCKHNSLILMDGSLASILIRPRPRPRGRSHYFIIDEIIDLINREDKDYFQKLLSCIDDTLLTQHKLEDNPICSSVVKPEISNEELRELSIVVAEYIEKLYVYGKLLERVLNNECKLVFIAKISYSNELLNLHYPDAYVFEKLTTGKGRSIEVIKKLSEYKELPINILRNVFNQAIESYLVSGIITLYARIEDNAPVLKLEIVGDYIDLLEKRAEYIDKIISMIRAVSSNGYPHPLRIAHKDSHITNKDIDNILRLAGLDLESTGREVLE